MALNLRVDERAKNVKTIKEMIQAAKNDLNRFTIETHKKLDNILQIVDTSFRQTTVNDREVQTEPNKKPELPPAFMNNNIFIRQDLFQSLHDNGQHSLQKQCDTAIVGIPITAINSDESHNLLNTVNENNCSSSSRNLDQSHNSMNAINYSSQNLNTQQQEISAEREEPTGDHQTQSKDMPIISESDDEQQIVACANSGQYLDMDVQKILEIAVRRVEPLKHHNTFELYNQELTENSSPLFTHQPIKVNVSEQSNDRDRSEDNEDSSSDDSDDESNDNSNDNSNIDRGNDFVINHRKWLITVQTVKLPYFPQLGDEVVYIQQCHKAFFSNYMNLLKLYQIHESDMPWSKLNLKAHEYAKVVEISFKKGNQQTRLCCCLRLEQTNKAGEKTGNYFDVEYHYPFNYVILRQHFDTAVARNWQVGSRFRQMLGNVWHFGRILEVRPTPKFECLLIKTDSGSEYSVSPWNIEPIDEKNLPELNGIPMPVTSEDVRKLRYQPKPNEWHQDGRSAICRRVQRELNSLMQYYIALPFLKLRHDPSYVSQIEYPIDLEIISARLGNLFYRRVDALEFDVRQLAKNFEQKDNELQSSTTITSFSSHNHQARDITNRILDIIKKASKPATLVSEIRDDNTDPSFSFNTKRRKYDENGDEVL